MKYIELVTKESSQESIKKIAQQVDAKDLNFDDVRKNGMQRSRMIVHDHNLQEALDSLSLIMGANATAKMMVMPIEAYLPKEDKDYEKDKKQSLTASRESIYTEVEKNGRANTNFVILIILSTIVASIGLIENSIAVVIGAMVIAPLLGPNIALSLATSLGDTSLMLQAIKSIIIGVFIAIFLPFCIAHFWDMPMDSSELLSRTYVGFDSVILALASGAAAALSVTTGLSSVLVGVMVAVALLPPAATFGIMLSTGDYELATNAGVLLMVNIVCVNLASKLIFLYKKITPSNWLEKEKAKKAMSWYIFTWGLTLAGLLIFIYFKP